MPVSRRRFGILLASAVAAAGVLRWVWPRKRPNVLLVTLDTTRADRLGCYGNDSTPTPRLDELSRRGVVFERAYAAAPLTLPSHASMLTGLWPAEHGIPANGEVALGADISTAAELFTQAGYETAAFVAAFVLDARFGLNRGFQTYNDNLSTAAASPDELDRYRDGRYVLSAVLNWLDDRKTTRSPSPFFCWMHLYDPHDPYVAHPEEFKDTFDSRLYDGEVAYTDVLLGRLLDRLQADGDLQNTVVVVTGDHGESLGEHGEPTHGYMLHESTLRVPLLIADPRFPQSVGRRVSAPVSLVDLYSTLLDSAGISHTRASGRSLRPLLEGAPEAPHPCYSMTDEPYREAMWSPLRSIVTERWRYVRTVKPELYDLQADPQELNNLADQNPDQLLQLERELAEIESRFTARDGTAVPISDHERRVLESLGYTAGQSTTAAPVTQDRPLRDIKDMIGYLSRVDEASALIRSRQFAQAAEILNAVIQEVPDYFKAMLDLGLCRMMQNQYDEAIGLFQRVLEFSPANDRAHDMLGFCYLRQRDLEQAMKHFLEVLKVRPDSENAHLYLGEINQRQGRFVLAIRHYETVLQLNPGNGAARSALQALRSAAPL